MEDTTDSPPETPNRPCLWTESLTEDECIHLLIREGIVVGFIIAVIIIAAVISTACIRSAIFELRRSPHVKFSKAAHTVKISSMMGSTDDDTQTIVEDRIRSYGNVVDEVKSKSNTNQAVYENPAIEVHSAEEEGIRKDAACTSLHVKQNVTGNDGGSQVPAEQQQETCFKETIKREEGWAANAIYESSENVA